MPAITERQAKTQYGLMPSGHVIGWSLKCASTLIVKSARIIRRLGIYEAREAADEGKDVLLVVRHPLDRLVSNYVFWRTTNAAAVHGLFYNHPENGPQIVLPDDKKLISIEEWYEFQERKYNAHWADQAEYHSDAKGLVPNVLYPWEVLGTLQTIPVNASPREGTWEDYFTPEFREKMEERYADDLALYERALSEWSGDRPKYF